jgi:hypothetical protein
MIGSGPAARCSASTRAARSFQPAVVSSRAGKGRAGTMGMRVRKRVEKAASDTVAIMRPRHFRGFSA